jgi:uncharacterized protein YndB with AHSA1/START domain
MSAVGESTTVVTARTFHATPERLFRAWTTPEEMKRWHSPAGMTNGSVTADLRVGGAYRVTMRGPDGAERAVGGVYREIDPPHKLVYTWQWEASPDFPETVVTVEFMARGSDTEVRVTHAGLPDAKSREQHLAGWTGCFGKMEQLLA